MERGPIVSEYHKLRDYLNRANKLSNQKTELKFEIEQFAMFEYRLYAISHGPHETHKLALAERNRNKIWERTGFTSFRNLEEFCTNTLNDVETQQGSPFKTTQISKELMNRLQEKISSSLSHLLLNKFYEP